MSGGILKTSGTKIVDTEGNAVLLRGTALGGWMLMENFMNGFPGREHQIRNALLKVLGKEKYEFFFDKFLEYFFTEKDAEFLASIGFNCVRLSFNYHHFEDDMNPFVIKEEGFKHLDRVIEICTKYKIYTILDLHAAPGGQNQDWHSDNPTGYAAFWDHKHFQDRVVNLWQVIAKRYRGNPWIAGYNPLNEPADVEWTRLLSFYDRIEAAIREIDSEHILFLEGNTFSMDFSGFEKVFPNSVYAVHDYCGFGFPNRIGRYQGLKEQDAYIRKMYDRKVEFMKKHDIPVWNGEFGPIYEKEEYNPDWKVQNDERYDMLDKQLAIYTSEEIGPMLHKKRQMAVDSWAYDDAHLQEGLFGPLHKWFEDNIQPPYNKKYPWQWRMHMHVFRGIRGITLAEYMIPEWADYFKGKSFEELDELAASWKYENCLQRERLNQVLGLYAPMKADDKRLQGNVIPSEADHATTEEATTGVGVFELAPDEKKARENVEYLHHAGGEQASNAVDGLHVKYFDKAPAAV
ncbi:putative endoglucanase c protein [Phaeoacremonium minimum UCRPA7]|uniref:Putative endoglucanase c protein n=1 Tax=Phaeoacremonium minimum (strain UCR-PA7) TaxID=1286976 RepID=R8B8P3_PHAM7|nr:putative endoglucanase c protein [Phaeoacremonium minimum UCRPA7]EON95663.1 putative endoglucanase c protein [Phaeoacremonium minimum UCRPA7]